MRGRTVEGELKEGGTRRFHQRGHAVAYHLAELVHVEHFFRAVPRQLSTLCPDSHEVPKQYKAAVSKERGAASPNDNLAAASARCSYALTNPCGDKIAPYGKIHAASKTRRSVTACQARVLDTRFRPKPVALVFSLSLHCSILLH